MSEDQPSELPVPDHIEQIVLPEAHIEPVKTALADIAVSTPPQEAMVDPLMSGPDVRWDKPKAETIAAVLKAPEVKWNGRDPSIYDKSGNDDDPNAYIDKELSPYEKFYDLNPNVFGPMPTSEFMKAFSAFDALSQRIEEHEYAITELEARKQEIVDEAKSLAPVVKVVEPAMESTEDRTPEPSL
ncbi:MAG: hypothetical protein JWO07_664 [Candidatus Saccharibacteria bacterium]|nr:hypothetical protein [Candidatus Saccharibacteria bacterium]